MGFFGGINGDEFGDEYDQTEHPVLDQIKSVKCKMCGEDGLTWSKISGCWALHEYSNNALHVCVYEFYDWDSAVAKARESNSIITSTYKDGVKTYVVQKR